MLFSVLAGVFGALSSFASKVAMGDGFTLVATYRAVHLMALVGAGQLDPGAARRIGGLCGDQHFDAAVLQESLGENRVGRSRLGCEYGG